MKTILGSILLCLVASLNVAAEEPVVFTQSANGSRALRPFTVKDHWETRWSSTKEITVWKLDREGEPLERLAHTTIPGTGATYQAKGGTFSLKIVSQGEWTITVVQLP